MTVIATETVAHVTAAMNPVAAAQAAAVATVIATSNAVTAAHAATTALRATTTAGLMPLKAMAITMVRRLTVSSSQ